MKIADPNALRARLDAQADGKAPRPRGNSVTAGEYNAVLPFAQACEKFISESIYPAYHRGADGDLELTRLAAPAEALPPTP